MAEHTESPNIIFYGKAKAGKDAISNSAKTVGTHIDRFVTQGTKSIEPKVQAIQSDFQKLTQTIEKNSAVQQLEKRAHESVNAVTPILNKTNDTVKTTYEHHVKPQTESIQRSIKKAIEWHAPKQWEQRLITQYDTVLTHLPRDKQEVAKRIRPNIEKAAHVAGYAITGTEVAVVVAVTCGTAYAITHPEDVKKLFRRNKTHQNLSTIYPPTSPRSETISQAPIKHIEAPTPVETNVPPSISEKEWNKLKERIYNRNNEIPKFDIQKPYISHQHDLDSVISRLAISKYGFVPTFLGYDMQTHDKPSEFIESSLQNVEVQNLFNSSVLGAKILWERLSKDYQRRKDVGITTWYDPDTHTRDTIYPDSEVIRFLFDVGKFKNDYPIPAVQTRLQPLMDSIIQWVKTENFQIEKHWGTWATDLQQQFPEIADHFQIQ